MILLHPSFAIAEADHTYAIRSFSTDGISEAVRCEFRHVASAPIFGPLDTTFLSDPAVNGRFQFTFSTGSLTFPELVPENAFAFPRDLTFRTVPGT